MKLADVTNSSVKMFRIITANNPLNCLDFYLFHRVTTDPVTFFVYFWLSVCLSSSACTAPTGRIAVKFYTVDLYESLLSKSKF